MSKRDKKDYFYYFGLLASVYILMVGGTSFVVHLTILGIVLLIVRRVHNGRTLKFKKKNIDSIYVVYYASCILTLITSRIYTDIPEWKWQAFVFFVYNSIILVFYILALSSNNDIVGSFIKGLKRCALIQVIYGYIQFLFYTLWSIDLNDQIFNKTFHLVERASHYNYGVLVPTGFSWHPGTFAPLLVIAYCLYFDNLLVKLLIIGIAFLSQSSTCVIGVLVVLILDIVFKAIDKRKKSGKINKKNIITVTVSIAIVIIIISQTNLLNTINHELTRLLLRFANRSASSTGDLSTYYHMRYFTGIWKIAKRANPLQILFGIGDGCSGYAFMKVFNQYVTTKAWEVESQIIADLINHGVVGFMLLYYWIIRIAIKGYKIDRRYSICITGILIESITYNVRFMWVLLFIMFLWISILKKKNIWIADNINLNVYTSKK